MAERIAELDNGVVVYQVTDEPARKSNIYCERSYCSPDSRWFIYQREVAPDGPVSWQFTAEYVACEFGTWQTRVLGRGYSYPEISRQGMLYYARPARDGTRELVRVDIATGQSQVIPVNGGVRPYTGMTISPDERRLGYGVALGFSPQQFGVEVADLDSGRRDVVCTDPYTCNPHTQFDMGDGHQIMVQHNRGCEYDAQGTQVRSLGEAGCTLFLVDVRDGTITRLAVGPPHTSSCTGHQQWIGTTQDILLTVRAERPYAPEQGNLLSVRAGQAARVAGRGYAFAHVHTSVCGRLFCCDEFVTGDVVIGSMRTGRSAVVCRFGPFSDEMHARYGLISEPMPYLSPDLKWVVYNACRTDRPEIYAASIPPEMVEELGVTRHPSPPPGP